MSAVKLHRKVVGISDMAVSKFAEDVIVTYSLGSCLAIVCYDPVIRAGGMIHVMLPDSGIEKMSKMDRRFNPLKYVDTGFDALLKQCERIGMKKRNICLGVFGGAQIFEREDHFNIGKRNYISFRKMVWKHGMLIKHEHVGGRVHRTVKLNVESGEIIVDVNKEHIVTYHCSLKK